MASPISSPQNVFALERMSLDGAPPSWFQWFAVSIPLCIICDFLIWLLLLLAFKPSKTLHEVVPIRKTDDPVTIKQIFVVIVTIITIILWCLNPVMKSVTGEMGTVNKLSLI